MPVPLESGLVLGFWSARRTYKKKEVEAGQRSFIPPEKLLCRRLKPLPDAGREGGCLSEWSPGKDYFDSYCKPVKAKKAKAAKPAKDS